MNDRINQLQVLASQVSGCTRCALHEKRTQTVFARGTGSSGLFFVGEGPGAEEDAQGFPFVGAAGLLLDKMIAAMGLSRDEVYVCNIVKCRPPNNRKPEPEEMAACMPYLAEQIELIEPSVIVALGATAVQGLLGTSEGIMRLRGKWKLYKGRIAVMPTFHPAYVLKTPEAEQDFMGDLEAVLRQMGRPTPKGVVDVRSVTFTIDNKSAARADHWKDAHGPCKVESPEDRQFQWRISTSTSGLGRVVHIACLSCGCWVDVTSYDDW